MSFSVSNQASGSFITAISGTKGIATQFDGINGLLYYSTNSGATWTQSVSALAITFSSISLSGNNGVAAGINSVSIGPTIYYTSNGGVTWTPTVSFLGISTSSIRISIYGSNAVVGVNSITNNYEVYYSNNGGSTWTLGFSASTGVSETVSNVAASSSSMIVVTREGINSLAWNSTNSGTTWSNTLSAVNVSNTSLSISGTNAIICGQNGISGYVRYSSNNGTTWSIPSSTPLTINNITNKVSIDGSVAMIGGINTLNIISFIWYSTDSGVNWTASTQALSNALTFPSISVSGNNGLAALNDTGSIGYLFYSTNQGATWTQASSLAATTINDVSLSGSQGISGTSAGIYYTSSPLCYESNTLILTVENEEEVYKKVSELKVGDLVKTYKQGYKKINLLRSFTYKPLDKNNELNLLYKHKENGVILTAGHSIVVDELTEEEKLNNKKYRFNQTIEDKKLLLACSSDKFEKIDDDQEYDLYHFSLESDEPKSHFGVYINDGLLSESCSEEALLRML